MPQTIDYTALAQQARQVAPPVDYAALAAHVRQPANGGVQSPYEETPISPDLYAGFAKEVGARAVQLGRLVHKIPGVDALLGSIPEDASDRLGLVPSNPGQKTGQSMEQIAEFMVPSAGAENLAASVAAKVAPRFVNAPRFVQAAAKLAPRMVTQGASAGAVTAAQGGNPVTGAIIGATGPVIGAGTTATAQAVGGMAAPMVRAAIKPTITAMRRVAGATAEGLDAKASSLVNFIIDKGLTTAAKAHVLITNAETELQRVLKTSTAVTDAPTRALRYLDALEKSAAKQALPAEDVAILRNAAAEVLEGKLGKDEITMVLKPHPTLVKPDGQPFMVLTPETARVPRVDVSPQEAMDLARSNSRWSTRKQWGEQKGATMEASKAIERAERDAVKIAVPEARPILADYSKGIQAKEVLDRMQFRQANREGIGMPEKIMAGAEMASGKLPVLAIASNWLRNNGLKGGIWADRLSKAVQQQNVTEVSSILNRLGVSLTAASATP